MKKSLKEQLERIHQLTYGEKILKEFSVDNILGDFKPTKKDDPKKADLVSDKPNELYQNLADAAQSNGLKQQAKGSMTYQKMVESMQIALTLLGYKLPNYGVDGLYGPETSAAVQNFNKNNSIQSDFASSETFSKLLELLKSKNIQPEDIKQYTDPVVYDKTFSNIDLSTDEGFQTYAQISNTFISKYPNPLGITGEMLATGARQAFIKYHKYVPPELALSQLLLEGGIGSNKKNSRPIRTRNPFNVGNVDSGSNKFFRSVQDAINTYFDLIARRYIGNGKTASDLLTNFVNKAGNRYATDKNYENKLNNIASKVNKISQQFVS